MSELRDARGLTEREAIERFRSKNYPKPSMTADMVVLAQDNAACSVLLIRRGGHPFLGRLALPGGFADQNEPLEKTAARELLEETGVEGITPELVGVYSAPGRDPRGWVVSAAYRGVCQKSDIHPKAGDDAVAALWYTVQRKNNCILLTNGDEQIVIDPADPQAAGLAFDHAAVLLDALVDII